MPGFNTETGFVSFSKGIAALLLPHFEKRGLEGQELFSLDLADEEYDERTTGQEDDDQ